MNKHLKKPRNEEMYKAILTLNTVEELMKFFDDLCTVSELQALSGGGASQRGHDL